MTKKKKKSQDIIEARNERRRKMRIKRGSTKPKGWSQRKSKALDDEEHLEWFPFEHSEKVDNSLSNEQVLEKFQQDRVHSGRSTSVTVEEFSDWVQTIHRHTWCKKNWANERSTLYAKYIRPSIDTRDMKVWFIEIEGFSSLAARENEKFDGNVCQLLEAKMDYLSKYRDEENERTKNDE